MMSFDAGALESPCCLGSARRCSVNKLGYLWTLAFISKFKIRWSYNCSNQWENIGSLSFTFEFTTVRLDKSSHLHHYAYWQKAASAIDVIFHHLVVSGYWSVIRTLTLSIIPLRSQSLNVYLDESAAELLPAFSSKRFPPRKLEGHARPGW